MENERPVASPRQNEIWGSDAIAALLRALDIPYIALNPGASFRGLHDSLVNYLGNERPQLLLCLHEESAVAMAHGYAKASGHMMGVALHSNVGLMHATMAIFNAWCDRVPMLILGATGPWDAARRRPWIDWIHTSSDQGALVRDYTKSDNQPASVPAAYEALLRAAQIATTAPRATFLHENAREALREADVVLSLDWIDTAGALKQAWGDAPVGAKVILVSPDAHAHRGWSMDYQGLPPADVYLMCEPDAVVPLLLEAVEPRAAAAEQRRAGEKATDGTLSLRAL